MQLFATIKHTDPASKEEVAHKLSYVLTNPYKVLADAVKVYGSEEAVMNRLNTLDDYHGSKGTARNEAYALLDEAIIEKLIKDTPETVRKFVEDMDIKVSHQLGGSSGPSPKDKENAETVFNLISKSKGDKLEGILVELDGTADSIGYNKPETWTVAELSKLRCAKRAWKRNQSKESLTADFI